MVRSVAPYFLVELIFLSLFKERALSKMTDYKLAKRIFLEASGSKSEALAWAGKAD